tara:strand:- start:17 stop:562 length:546 start_codon:yes stop_codon:yes gene_type:complete
MDKKIQKPGRRFSAQDKKNLKMKGQKGDKRPTVGTSKLPYRRGSASAIKRNISKNKVLKEALLDKKAQDKIQKLIDEKIKKQDRIFQGIGKSKDSGDRSLITGKKRNPNPKLLPSEDVPIMTRPKDNGKKKNKHDGSPESILKKKGGKVKGYKKGGPISYRMSGGQVVAHGYNMGDKKIYD